MSTKDRLIEWAAALMVASVLALVPGWSFLAGALFILSVVAFLGYTVWDDAGPRF